MNPREFPVKRRDLKPVRLVGALRLRVDRGDGCLELVRRGLSQAQSLLKKLQAFPDTIAIPE